MKPSEIITRAIDHTVSEEGSAGRCAVGLVTVLIENSYGCGNRSDSTAHVRYPKPGEGLADWWQDVVADLTGDGHSCGVTDGSVYEATIVAAADAPHLIHETMTWQDS